MALRRAPVSGSISESSEQEALWLMGGQVPDCAAIVATESPKTMPRSLLSALDLIVSFVLLSKDQT